MSFAGTVFDMIRRTEAHRAAAKARREYTAHLHGLHMGVAGRRRLIEDKDMPSEELLRIKREIMERLRRERRQTLVLTVFVGIFAVAVVVGILFFVLWVIKV